MKKFLSVAFGVVLVATTFFIGGAKTASAANPPSIYDYDIESLISRIAKVAKQFDVNLSGKNYFTYGKDKGRYCVINIGDGKNAYIGFRLNADNSVRYAYVGINDIHDKKSLKDLTFGLIFMFSNVEIETRDYQALTDEMVEYIDYVKKNNLDVSKISKKFTRYCPSINKDVYLRVHAINEGKGVQFRLGADS